MKVKRGLLAPAYKRGYNVLKDNGVVVVAMSIGNSYFIKEKIEELLNFLNDNFSQVKLLIADAISEHTYKAIGYKENKARRKSRLGANLFRNNCIRTIQGIRSAGKKVNIEIIDWYNKIEHNSEYEKQLFLIHDLYLNNKDFKKEADKTTRAVLLNKIKKGVKLSEAINEGVMYLIEELAFVLASPRIFGVKTTAYVYHREWPVYVNLIDGKYDGVIRKDTAFIQLSD